MPHPLRRAALAAFAFAGCALVGCGDDAKKGADLTLAKGDLSETEKAQVVARVGDEVITLEEFEARLNQQSPFARARYDSPQRKREFLDALVRFELIAAEAERRGYGDDPDVELARKQAMVRAFTAGELRDLVDLADITDADIEAYYTAHEDEFARPAQVRVSHLVVAEEGAARALLEEVSALVAADPLKARDVFAEFVRRHATDDETRINAGDLGFVGEPGVSKTPDQANAPPPVARAAFAIDAVGGLAPEPVQSSAGWHIVQKTGFRRPYRRELDDARTSIRNTLFRQRKAEAMEAFVADLRGKAKITIDEALLEAAKTVPQGQPMRGIAPPGLDPGDPLPIERPGDAARPPRPRLPGLPPPTVPAPRLPRPAADGADQTKGDP